MFININNIYILCIVANMYKSTINIKDIEKRKTKVSAFGVKTIYQTNPSYNNI